MIRAAFFVLVLAAACTVDVPLEPPPNPVVDAGPSADSDPLPLKSDATVLVVDGGNAARDAGRPDAR